MSEVIVYTTPTCHFCIAVKDFLKEKRVNYKEIDVSKDQTAAQEMINKSGQMGVPVIDFDGEIVIGFDEEKIESLIKKS